MTWWKSWTLWFNVLGGGFEIFQQLAGANLVSGPQVITALAIGNIALRVLKTKTPLTVK
jgi:hypothetical protein